MAEYIEREALMKFPIRIDHFDKEHGNEHFVFGIESVLEYAESLPTADVVSAEELKEFAEDVIYQFGYHCNPNGRLHLTAGGLSTLESAFAILGWPDPKPYPEGECEWDGCHEYANCGTPTPNGYMCVCGKHYWDIQARKEAEEVARMDGE